MTGLNRLPGAVDAEDVAENLEQTIRDNAAGPAQASVDDQSVSQHSLKDQIEADRYFKSQEAAKTRKGLGIRRTRIIPPGGAG